MHHAMHDVTHDAMHHEMHDVMHDEMHDALQALYDNFAKVLFICSCSQVSGLGLG